MSEKQQVLEKAIESLDEVCKKIIEKNSYLEQMPFCISTVNEAVTMLMKEKKINQEYLLQLLEDMMYGMSQQDEVFLLDVLRFGLKAGFESIEYQFEN